MSAPRPPTVAHRGEVWSTASGAHVLILQVDALAARPAVVCAAVTLRAPAAEGLLRVPLGGHPPVAWVATNLVVTLARAELTARRGVVGDATLARIGSALVRILGLGEAVAAASGLRAYR